MTHQLPPRRFTPFTQTATDYPVLLVDSDAPFLELHACLRERLNAALDHLNLMAYTRRPDFAENEINSVTNTARILIQDVSDLFRAIEYRSFDTPKESWSRFRLQKTVSLHAVELTTMPSSSHFSKSTFKKQYK